MHLGADRADIRPGVSIVTLPLADLDVTDRGTQVRREQEKDIALQGAHFSPVERTPHWDALHFNRPLVSSDGTVGRHCKKQKNKSRCNEIKTKFQRGKEKNKKEILDGKI